MLDDQILHALEERWQTHGAETLSRMAPGLSDDEIDRIAAPLGFALPEEIRTLYRWHDGSGRYHMIWGRGMLQLRVAVVEAADPPSWDESRRPGWMQLLDERPYLMADCAVGVDDPVPIWHYGPDWEEPTRPVFASIGDMVAFWINLIDDGIMYWDPDTSMWDVRQPLLDDIAIKLAGVPLD